MNVVDIFHGLSFALFQLLRFRFGSFVSVESVVIELTTFPVHLMEPCYIRTSELHHCSTRIVYSKYYVSDVQSNVYYGLTLAIWCLKEEVDGEEGVVRKRSWK